MYGDGIVKSLPREWFVDQGRSAEMRWEAMRGQGQRGPGTSASSSATTPPRRSWTRATYRLELFGRGLRGGPVSFSYDELTAMPSVARTVAIECAGNGRGCSRRSRAWRSGHAVGLGAIGVARWRGVPLARGARARGIRDDAVDLMPVGLDAPYVADGIDHGRVRRPLPVGKALDDVLLAYEMNGETLPPDHGFPLRLVVPGWIGIASVKWVGSIEVSTIAHVVPVEHEVVPAVVLRAGGQERVRAAVERRRCRSAAGARCTAARGRRAGRSERVDVSTDGGASWHRAQLHGPTEPGMGALDAAVDPRRRGAPSCSRGRPTPPACASPTACRSTARATCSGRSPATR